LDIWRSGEMAKFAAGLLALLAVGCIALLTMSPQAPASIVLQQQRMEMLKAYQVRVQAPAGMGPVDAPSGGGSQVR